MQPPSPEVEPVAIVGLACRLPGGANTPSKLWDLAHSGRQCWQDVPSSRYNWKAFHHPDPEAKGTHNARGGFFLNEDISAFDANFFGIPVAEANAIDPQQRLLLEVSYEALENAGLPLENLRGSRTGVYVALVSRDYDRQVYKDPYLIPKHHLTGCGDATACGRISYAFDLRGPCMSLDTGCSGGMVALHLACQALRLGETDAAIVGGTNLLLAPDMTIAMSALRMVNDNGRCYPFDSRGAGYGRAEGVAAVILKRLKDALRDGDNVRAVIRNTGVNQDGKTNGILLPSSEAQGELTAALYRQAGLNPQDVCYVEAHGTGTQAGDVAEVNSIKHVFVDVKAHRDHPLFLGSIKANLGHSESTSGLAGVIKTVMALEKAVIPPVAALETVKPSLDNMLGSGDIIIPRKPQPWPHQGPRLASVNSFGFGGTNAHVILESAPGGATTRDGLITPPTDSDDDIASLPVENAEPQLFVVSAKSKASLQGIIQDLKHWITTHGTIGTTKKELAKTLSSRRSRFNWRSSFVASSFTSLLSALEGPRLTKASPNKRVVFLFTGQGAQYHGMGRELLRLQTDFAKSLHRSQDILTGLGASWRLVDELLCEESMSRINTSELSQPATTAIQIALVDLLAELGVQPAMVLGHSSGEVAAAYAAGILGHREALTVSYHKGFVAGWCKEAVPFKGAMLAVGLGEPNVLPYVRQQRGRLGKCVVACVNSPSSVTLSGDETAIAEMQELLNKESVFNRRLRVDIAYHSHHMQAVSERFLQSISGVVAKPPQSSIRYFSSVTGSESTSPLGPMYWVDNLVSQVCFAPALEGLTRLHYESNPDSNLVLLEIGPHGALQGPIRQNMISATIKWSYTPTLVRNKDAHEAALEMVGGLFENGVQLDLTTNLSQQNNGQEISIAADLPSYSWDHSNNYWHESRLSREYRFREHPPHDLLGLRLNGTSTIEPVFRHILSVDDHPWLQEHIIDGFALYPGSAFLCMAIEALRQVSKDRGEKHEIAKYIFHEVSFSKALVVPDSPDSIEVLISLKPSHASKERLGISWEEFRVTSVAGDGKWSEHCRGSIRAEYRSMVAGENSVGEAREQEARASLARDRVQAMRESCRESVSPEAIYNEMRRNGIDYGDTFAIIRALHLGDRQALGRLQVPDIRPLMPSQHMQPHVIHPAVFDAFMHIVLPLYHRHCSQGPVMLVSVGEVSISADMLNEPGNELLVACRLTEAGRRQGSVEVSVMQEDSQGHLVEVGSLSREDFRAIGESSAPEKTQLGQSLASGLPPPCYYLDWVPAPWFPRADTEHAKHTGDEKIHISCLSETPMTLYVAKDILSHLCAHWSSDKCAIIPHIPDTMDPEAIHIIILDASNLQSAEYDPPAAYSRLGSSLWITLATGQPVGPGTLMHSLARMVPQDVRLKTVILDYHQDTQVAERHPLPKVITDILQACFVDTSDAESPVEHRHIYRHGSLLVPRLAPNIMANQWLDARINGKGIKESASFHGVNYPINLHFEKPGLLDSAVFLPIEDSPAALGPEEVLVKVYAHAVNQSDIAIAQGRGKATDCMMGEFSGEILAVGSLGQNSYKLGDRVCGWGSMPYTNIARVFAHRVHRIDDDMSFVEAASIPIAFQTAAHALFSIARLEKAQSILIHGAAGAVGQAAITIAQYLSADVYATVGSSEKQRLLTRTKNIPKSRIFSSLSTSFKDSILRLTDKKGVDVVLNCSSGDLLGESMACVADCGYLIDITRSKRPLTLDTHLGRNITFATVDMQLLATKRPTKLQDTFAKVMGLYREGMLKPIAPITTMSIADVTNAFRLGQSQQYSGKIVLEADEQASVKQIAPRPEPIRLSSSGTYVVLGGSEDINNALRLFLRDHGAENIINVVSAGLQREENSYDDSPLERLEVDLEDMTEVLSAISFNPGGNDHPINGIFVLETVPEKTRAHIGEAFKDQPPEFLITISPADALLNTKAGATNARLSESADGPSNSMTIHIGDIENVDLYNILEYCMSPSAQQNSHRELFTGINIAAYSHENPIFGALRAMATDNNPRQADPSAQTIDQQIARTENLDELHRIVTAAVIQQLASFLALDADDIHVGAAVADVGLDSLVAIEFKNWIVRSMQAPIQASEILDAPSLSQLVQLVVQRSKLCQNAVSQVSNGDEQGDQAEEKAMSNGHSRTTLNPPAASTTPPTRDAVPTTIEKIPALPVPDFKDLIKRHLSYLRAFATEEEYENTLNLATDFQSPDGMGKRLYDRLQAIKAANPETWYHDLYLRNQYLVRNGSLAPYMSFFFTHPPSRTPHSQATRAAIVASTVIRYMFRLRGGLLKPRYVNEQPLSMELYRYLFNTCREPRAGIDVMGQYPGNNYFVVLRRGHVYRVEFEERPDGMQSEVLEAVFEGILEDSPTEVDWLGMLTADDRISWAKNRQAFMELNDENNSYIQTIEKSAFVICLDDGNPNTAEERGYHFHFGDGSNRWYDKPVEYIIAANGASGILGDHTAIDAGTVHELNLEIAECIQSYQKSRSLHIPTTTSTKIAEITHTTLPAPIQKRIQTIHTNYSAATTCREHRYPPPLPYGSTLMKTHKIPPNSAFQLLVQLAARYYFTTTPPCWETVLQSNFAQGRVEINQVVTTQVATFLSAATNDTLPIGTVKKLFIDAARAHSASVMACTRAGGSDRFLSMLREIVEEGEEEPGLFQDPVYKRVRPRKFISNCFTTGMAENGCVLREEDGVWLHFEVGDEQVRFSIVGPKGGTEGFSECLVRAAKRVEEIVGA